MKEQLISFETAKLAEKSGFSIRCDKGFDYYGEEINETSGILLQNGFINRPTQSLLQKWLREKYEIYCVALPWKDHAADVNDSVTFRPMIYRKHTGKEYKTYEEALEVVLFEALKLIP